MRLNNWEISFSDRQTVHEGLFSFKTVHIPPQDCPVKHIFKLHYSAVAQIYCLFGSET